MSTKIVGIRVRARAKSDTYIEWRDARGHVKASWMGKLAIHKPIASIVDGLALGDGHGHVRTKMDWTLTHLPSGYSILNSCNAGFHVTKARMEAAIDYACKDVHGWVLAMEFDHHEIESGDTRQRIGATDPVKMFRDAVIDHLRHADYDWWNEGAGSGFPASALHEEAEAQFTGSGATYVDCDAGCGHSASVEPDAYYACPECDGGWIKSPIERVIRGEA